MELCINVSSPCRLTQTVRKLSNTSSLTVADYYKLLICETVFDHCAERLILVAICITALVL